MPGPIPPLRPMAVVLDCGVPPVLDDLKGELIIAGERSLRRMLLCALLPGVCSTARGSSRLGGSSINAGERSARSRLLAAAGGGLTGVASHGELRPSCIVEEEDG